MWLINFFKKKQSKQDFFEAEVLGKMRKFKALGGKIPCGCCLEAFREHLEAICTVCASCGELIYPGDPVGQAWDGAPHPYTHLTFECCETAAFYCGVWGKGELVSLHELDPDKYPEGTKNILHLSLMDMEKGGSGIVFVNNIGEN